MFKQGITCLTLTVALLGCPKIDVHEFDGASDAAAEAADTVAVSCTTDAECDAPNTCHEAACNTSSGTCEYTQLPDTCFVGGVCFLPDQAKPGDNCQVCSPAQATDTLLNLVCSNGGTCDPTTGVCGAPVDAMIDGTDTSPDLPQDDGPADTTPDSSETGGEVIDDATTETGGETVDDATTETGGEVIDDATTETGGEVTDDATTETLDDTADDEISGSDTDLQIAAAQAAAEAGETIGSWMVDGAGVTVTKAALGSDLAGFFVQAGPEGPALFVRLAQGSHPAVGDNVTFEITELSHNEGRTEAVAILGLASNSSGNDYSVWAQDVTAVDLSAELNTLESELVTITGTFDGDFAYAGTAFVGADLMTDGDATGNIVVRMPTTEADILTEQAGGSLSGCTASFTGPMWRFNNTPQPSVWTADEVTMVCPAIAVLSATSVGATTVEVHFSQVIDETSLKANGEQFTFDGGLSADVATVVGDLVLVELTSPVVGGTDYSVTVDATLLSAVDGQGVNPAANAAGFTGVTIAASHLVISEADPDQSFADTMEFVEIYNPTDLSVEVTNYELRFINGTGATVYEKIVLSGSIPAGGYVIIGSQLLLDSVDNGAIEILSLTGMQNGPDGFQLVDAGGVIIDSMSYGGDLPGTTEGVSASSDSGEESLQRCPAGVDTDDNSVDFVALPATPGADCQ